MMKYLLIILMSSTAHARLNDVERAFIEHENLLENPSFVHGRAAWSLSSGSFSVAGSGRDAAATWDASATSQALCSRAVAVPARLHGQNGYFKVSAQVPSGTAAHDVYVYDGSGDVGPRVPLISGSEPQITSGNFIFPTSGTLQLCIESTQDEPSISVFSGYLGDALNLTNVRQSSLVGTAYYPATGSCNWPTSSASMAGFTSAAACPGPTVIQNPGPGIIQTTDNDLPQWTVNDLPPGEYVAVITVAMAMSASSAAALAISDGTTTSPEHGLNAGTNLTNENVTVKGFFTYTTGGNKTFALHGKRGAGTLTADNSNYETTFELYRYPLSSEQSLKPDQLATSWSGRHESDCSWVKSGTGSYGDYAGDATCTFSERTNTNFGAVTSASDGNNTPGIVFTPKRAGTYKACVRFNEGTGSNVVQGFRLFESTHSLELVEMTHRMQTNNGQPAVAHNMCGLMKLPNTNQVTLKLQAYSTSGTITSGGNATIGTPAVEWTVYAIDQQIPAPHVINSVVSSYQGVIGEAAAVIDNNGTATINTQYGDAIASVNRNSPGDVTVTFKTGYFSAAPICQCLAENDSGIQVYVCSTSSATTPTATTYRYETVNGSNTITDRRVNILCKGPR